MNENAQLVQRGFDAFAQADMATLDQLISDDVVWVSEGQGVLSGRFEGKGAVFANWALIPAETEGTFRQDVVELFADSRVVVAVTEVTATRRGVTRERQRGVIVFVVRDGKVVEGRVIPQDAAADEEFWAV